MVTADDIRREIQRSVSRITGLPAERIADEATYRDDLGLDSLSMLEMTVDMQYAFKVKIPDERLTEIVTVGDSVRIVQELAADRP